MAIVRAFIENIIYYNEENYYSVLSASSSGGELTIVGNFPHVSAGETIEAEGEFTEHPLYGVQFKAVSFHIAEPEGTDAVMRYLAGGAIKGIGPKLAGRITDKFGPDTLRIIEEEPLKLTAIKGISKAMALSFAGQAEAKRGMRDAFIFMQECGIGSVLANRIYEKYGPFTYSALRNNPYKIAEEIDGVGFRKADSIAAKMGIKPSDKLRIRCGIIYALREAVSDGHTYLPLNILKSRAGDLLGLEPGDIDAILTELQVAGRIKLLTEADGEEVYFAAYYYCEQKIAGMLKRLSVSCVPDNGRTAARIRQIAGESGIELDERQEQAIIESRRNGFSVITGGPGTGKTTTINAIIRFYSADHLKVCLAAPTGRAAKRMTEATGCEAKTIHRLLEYTGLPTQGNAPGTVSSHEGTDRGPGAAPYAGSGNAYGAGATDGKGRFLRDEKDPLEADVLIVDEASMIDIFLMEALLKAVSPGTRLILVGDSDQLPSVGPGNVLKDIIDSGVFSVVRLDHIFRQAAESDIVLNAHRINHGEPVDLARRSKDFLFIRNESPQSVIDNIKRLITDKLPAYVGCSARDIQVISATKIGLLGIDSLNAGLQEFLNPPGRGKNEKKIGETVFRTGDKVMQVKNDYELIWRIYDGNMLPAATGAGIFNGDIGYIKDIDIERDIITVIFDEAREVEYDGKHMKNLELAYAVTVHKSQGSEYPAVIMPMMRGPHLLMNRNLLYTAVTRAKKCVVLVGIPAVFEEMKHNENENKRYSGLKNRILEMFPEKYGASYGGL